LHRAAHTTSVSTENKPSTVNSDHWSAQAQLFQSSEFGLARIVQHEDIGDGGHCGR
jgi:hypothetical protein